MRATVYGNFKWRRVRRAGKGAAWRLPRSTRYRILNPSDRILNTHVAWRADRRKRGAARRRRKSNRARILNTSDRILNTSDRILNTSDGILNTSDRILNTHALAGCEGREREQQGSSERALVTVY
ncbi:hypothetical protein T484DRAFT_1952416 [Baffinella frigidus]|nr:hypothetical protein T484DRAFT_1952416 [Cryptophyta sp. CCMP2293]